MAPQINSDIQLSKVCPECGRDLKIRTNSTNGSQFIACTGFPDCRHTETIPETLKMQLAGAPTLFDVPTEPAIDRRKIERCKSCGAAIVWGVTKNGKRCPYNVVGMQATEQSHFETCPQSRGWSQR